MTNPIISIVAPAHKTMYWLDLYKSIITNLSFEIIFVSDKHPDFNLPPNFRYIYSTVKPVQCFEIALREAKGEFIHWTADDTTYNEFAFDNAVELYRKYNNYKLMVAFKTIESDIDKTELHRLFYPRIKPKNAPRVMPYGIITSQLVKEIGRCDKNFIAGQWENDLIMRAYASGAKMIVSYQSIAYNDSHKEAGENNPKKYFVYETKLLKNLWWKCGSYTYHRRKQFEPFADKNLLTISQKPTGQWQ